MMRYVSVVTVINAHCAAGNKHIDTTYSFLKLILVL